ncbi:hypothetical protein [Myxococcus eversor]|uniref:hypothetical protein n=1 Tax=Myxococcus eversor TaxID=2709661 RepID=UPI0013D2A01A|nr:hypothetical protein [Myxococcus eversor]
MQSKSFVRGLVLAAGLLSVGCGVDVNDPASLATEGAPLVEMCTASYRITYFKTSAHLQKVASGVCRCGLEVPVIEDATPFYEIHNYVPCP